MNNYEVIGIPATRIIQLGDSILDVLVSSLENSSITLENNDVLIISSKIVSMEQESGIQLGKVKVSSEAQILAKEAQVDPEFAQIVLDESKGQVLGSVTGAILTKSEYGLLPNAGLDLSNAPNGYTLFLPRFPDNVARTLKNTIYDTFDKNIAIIISDSNIMPLRRGTFAIAIGTAGLEPVIDERGRSDLFGRELKITTLALADNLATSANIVMGESSEQVPFVIIRGVISKVTNNIDNSVMRMAEDECLVFAPLNTH